MSSPTFDKEHASLLEEEHQKTIENIRQLQDMEKYMYQNLAKLTGQEGSESQEEQIMRRIDELTQMRLNLFNQLKNEYTDATDELHESRRSLRDQVMTVKVVEDELDQTKEKYNELSRQKNNKIRMVQIGNYQAQRYSAHIDVLKMMSLTALILIGVAVIYHHNLLPGSVVGFLTIIILAVSGLLILRKILDLARRSDFVYDQYDWNTNHKKMQETSKNTISGGNKPSPVAPSNSDTKESFSLYF